MKIRNYIFVLIFVLLISTLSIIYTFRNKKVSDISIVQINDIIETIKDRWNEIDNSNLPDNNYQLDYVILDNNNKVLAYTRNGLNTSILNAIKNRDMIIDISEDGQIIGKLIIYNDTFKVYDNYRITLLTYSIIIVIFIAVFFILNIIVIDKSIFKPFRKLQKFSHHVAEGNLDIPLEMDKRNWFGSFTESFDLMRTELAIARENESQANKSKKELVASLSHDIKTPVASIKAVSELLLAKSKDLNLNKQLEIINTKADQINTLITNMFNATLEELQELRVNVIEESSLIISDIIKNADYNKKCNLSPIPECLIYIDPLRLEQIIDNIISNSYKYALTTIDIYVRVIDGFLEIDFRDYGNGVDNNDLAFLTNKYYRGKNATSTNGAGLGLYISNYMINKMSGEISFHNLNNGFCVKLKLLIV